MPITGRPRDLYDEWLEQNRQYESQYIANQAEDIYAGWRPQAGYPVTYWENPQRVARYHDLRQAMGPEWQPPDWLDAGLNDAAYEYYKHVNGGNPNPNTWLNLDQNDPMREVLRSMPPPPDNMLWPDEQQYAQQQYAPGELLNPEQGGMTQAQWDALKPWQRTMYGMANNPETMGTVTGAAAGGIGMGNPLAGAAGGGLLGNLFGSLSMTPVKDADGNTVKDPVTGLPVYQENKKLSWLMKLMNGLDYGAELIERSMGTAYQLTGSVFNPEEYGSLSEVLGNLPAAWRAAHLTDESGGFLNYIDLYMQAYGSNLSSEEIRRRASFMPDVSDPLNYVEAISAAIEGREANIANIGETWTWDSPVPVRPEGGMGLAAIVDARRRLAAGEAPTDVWNAVTAQHGMTGFTTDLIGHIVLDPLNIAGPLAVGTILDPLAKATNNVPLLKAITETGGEGPIKVLQTYGQNVRNLPVEDIPHNWITRRLAGLDADYNWKTLQQTQTKVPTWKKGLAVGQKAFTGVLLGNLVGGPVGAAVGGMTGAIIGIGSDMTPVAKAMEVLNSAGLTLHTVLSRAGADPDLMVKYVRSLSNTPVDLASEIGMQSIKSPETASLPMFLKDALKGADELLVKYKANQQNAKLLDQLEAATGMPANKILQQIQNNPKQADVLLRQMIEKARASADPAAKKLVEAYDDAQATMHKLPPEAHPTGQKLVDAVKTFTGDNPAPRNAEQFRAHLFAQLMDAGDKWAVDWFGVKPDPKWARLGALVKSAQNLALLGLNPTYLVNNALNNVVTMAAEGVLGLKTPEQIVKFWDEFGVMSPRLKAGYGPAASGTETSHLALRSAMDVKDTLQAATDFLNRTSDKVGIFGRLSQKFEQLSSAEAVTTGTQQAWNRLHRRGTGFALMDGGLEAELRNAGVRPEDVYALIEGAMNQKDLEARLWQGTGTNRLDRAVPAIVEQYAKRGVKLDPGEVKTLLQEAGVYKDLTDTLAGAETIEDVHRAFRATEGKIQNHIRKLTQDAYMARVMADAAVVKTEGQPGTLRMWDDLNMAEAEAFNGHWQRSAELQQKLMENPDQEASLWDEFFRNERAEYDTFYKEQEGKVLAILYGTGIQNPEARSIADGYVKRADNWRDFYKARDQMYETIRSEKFDTREARNAAWNKLHDDMEKLYQEAYGRDLEYQIETDGKFIDKVKIIFPERVPAIEAWRSDMVTFRREVYGRMARFRQMLRTMPAEERGAAWTKFLNEEYMPLYRDYLQKQVDGAHAIAGKMSGEAPEVPGGKVPEPPVKPSGTPSEQVVELARQAGIATATKDGKPMDKAVVNTVNKYTGKKYTKIEDTPEFLQDFKDALRRKKVVDVKTKVVDNAADLSNIPREDLLLVLRETIDEARVEHEGRVTAEAKADTDTLTGYKTYTMSGPDDTGPKSQFNPEVDKAKAVAVLDFEGLAYTNNTYGHPQGNALIREFVRAANEIAAEFGVELYRGSKGGDEFIIPGKNITTVKKVAQRIREAFAKGRLVVKEKDGSTYSVTGFGLHVGTGRNFADADAAAKLDVTPGYVRNERPPNWQYTRIDEPRGADAVVRDAEPPEIRAGEEAAGRVGEAGTAETEPLTPETIKQLDNEAAVMEAEDADIAQVQQAEALTSYADAAVEHLEGAEEARPIKELRQELRDALVEVFGYDGKQAASEEEVFMRLAQNIVAKREGISTAEAYQKLLADVRRGGLPEGGVRYQAPQRGPVWYSQLEKVVTDIPQEKMTVEQLKAALAKGGVKADELYWTGFEEWMQGKTRVTKQEALEFIQANKVEVNEVVRGEPGDAARLSEIEASIWDLTKERDEISRGDMNLSSEEDYLYYQDRLSKIEQELKALRQERDALTPGGTRYQQYTLPGGENYRELLFTLPQKEVVYTKVEYDQMAERFYERDYNHLTASQQHQVRTLMESDTGKQRAQDYTSPHWQEPNTVAHVRFNERVDADGKRVLFIEEVQSDWHQAGREKGYKETVDPNKITAKYFPAEPGQDPNIYPGYWESYDQTGRLITRHPGRWDEAKVLEDARQAASLPDTRKVPPAPFSKSWPEFTMKRMLRWAAENGFERVAWTTGEQQAARYNLSNHIDTLEYGQRADSKAWVITGTKEGKEVVNNAISDADLEGFVGRDVAQKMRAGEGERSGSYNPQIDYKVLKGDDLKLSHSGMKGFYDQILPRTMEKYGKKWGVRVGETEIPTRDRVYAVEVAPGKVELRGPQTGATIGTYSTMEAALKAIDDIDPPTMAHSLDITPAMRESVMQGQPMFQSHRAATSWLSDGRAVIHALEAPDITSFAHETVHVFLPWLDEVDLRTAEEWAGVKDGRWTVEQEENLANAWVQYRATAEAPTPALVRIFENFKKWVLEVYTSLVGTEYDQKINPKLREMFDRWLMDEAQKGPEAEPDNIQPLNIEAEPARIEDVPGVEVVRAEVEAPKPKKAKAPKVEKPGKFGYTQAEVEQIAPKLKEWVDANVPETAREAVAGWINKKETVEVAAKPLHITIPGSELTIKNVSAGIYLYKLLTGKPMPGFEQAKITTPLLTSGRIGVGVGAFVPKGGELSRDVYAAIRLYGSPQEAANTIRAQMGTNPEGVGWDTLRMSNVLMELERLASHPEKQQAKYIADAQAAQSWELQPTRFMKPSKGKYLFQPSRWFQTDGGAKRVLYPQTQARTDTPEFRAWFGESKVVDEQGQPLVVYHSTDAADITRFRSKGYSGLNTDGNASDPAMAQTSRLGHWFSHRDITPETQQNIVYPVYLTIEHPYKTNLDSLVDEIKDIGSGTALKRKLMAEGYDGIILEDTEFGGMSYVAFRPEQIKSTFNRGTYSKSSQNILYQSGDGRVHQVKNDGEAPEAIGHMGAADSLDNMNPPVADMAREGWEKNIRPLMKELERYLTSPDGMAPDTVRGRANALDPQTARKLRVYMEQVKGQMADTKLQSVKYGEMKRDRSLLNYSRRYGFDNVLQMAMPYQFWYTRSALNWAMRAIDNPGYLAAWAKIRQAQERAVNSPGFPKRLQNKMRIPIPFLPEWMGGGLYVDPLRQLFPFENFLRPFEQMERDQNLIDRRAQFILLGWAEDGTEEEAEVQQALAAMSGPTWERAYAQAQMEVETDTSNPWDFASLMMGYSLPIEWMRRYATGKQDQIGQLPITRLVQAATGGVLQLNKGRGLNLEGPLRRALGLPEYGAYTDYYLDRMLASMAADGTITTDEALRAMVDRSGPAFEEAQARVSDTNSLKLAAGGFAPDIFPEGEQIGRAEYTEYQKAIEAWQAGDETAMTTFYDKFPEYEARKAINQEPDVRLHKYLIGAVWDAYRALPELHQQQAAEALGEQFEQQFLNKETRSYDGITSETLAYWAQALGGHAPDSMGEQPAADLGLADEATTAAYQGYLDAKKQMFPNLSAVQNVYFKIPEGPARDAYAAKHPELDEYNVWRNAYLADNPEIIQYVIGEENKVYGASPEEQALYYQFNATRDYRYPGIFQLQDQYYALPSNQRRGFLQQYPQLAEYWDWRREWLKQYPNMIPYIMSTESLYQAVFNETMPAVSNTGAYPVGGPTPQVNIMDGFSQPLMRQLTGWAYAGQSLGTGAQRELMTHWREQGQPGTFDEWMERVRAQVRDQ
jgi:GGDEF domain-containing protein